MKKNPAERRAGESCVCGSRPQWVRPACPLCAVLGRLATPGRVVGVSGVGEDVSGWKAEHAPGRWTLQKHEGSTRDQRCPVDTEWCGRGVWVGGWQGASRKKAGWGLIAVDAFRAAAGGTWRADNPTDPRLLGLLPQAQHPRHWPTMGLRWALCLRSSGDNALQLNTHFSLASPTHTETWSCRPRYLRNQRKIYSSLFWSSFLLSYYLLFLPLLLFILINPLRPLSGRTARFLPR